MKTAVCDQEAFYPLRNLVEGPLGSIEDLTTMERLLRAVVLHDEVVMEFTPLPYDEDTETADEYGNRYNIVAFGPILTGYDFFSIHSGRKPPVPNLDISPELLQVASTFANAGEGTCFVIRIRCASWLHELADKSHVRTNHQSKPFRGWTLEKLQRDSNP